MAPRATAGIAWKALRGFLPPEAAAALAASSSGGSTGSLLSGEADDAEIERTDRTAEEAAEAAEAAEAEASASAAAAAAEAATAAAAEAEAAAEASGSDEDDDAAISAADIDLATMSRKVRLAAASQSPLIQLDDEVLAFPTGGSAAMPRFEHVLYACTERRGRRGARVSVREPATPADVERELRLLLVQTRQAAGDCARDLKVSARDAGLGWARLQLLPAAASLIDRHPRYLGLFPPPSLCAEALPRHRPHARARLHHGGVLGRPGGSPTAAR